MNTAISRRLDYNIEIFIIILAVINIHDPLL